MKHILFSFLFLLTVFAKAQGHKEVTWNFSLEKSGKDYVIKMEATIQSGWHIYSQNIKGDGPVPTSFTFELPKGSKLKGKTNEPEATEVFDESFGMKVKYFSNKVVFTQKISGKLNGEQLIKGKVNYMICNDQMCLPPVDVPFEIKL
jgi:thiol:disulfide interchange protein DsbD